MLMNSNFILDFSKAFAERIHREAKDHVDASVRADLSLEATESESVDSSRPSPPVEQIIYAWQLAYGRVPTPEEFELAAVFLRQQYELLTAQRHEEAAAQALINYCQTLLNSNEFLYLE